MQEGWKPRNTLFIVGSKHGNMARQLIVSMERLKPIVGFDANIFGEGRTKSEKVPFQ